MFVVKHRSSLATAAIGLIALLAVARSQATQAPATVVSPGSDRPARATSTGWTPVAAPQSEETGPWLDHELMVAARDGESLVWIADMAR